LLIAIALVLIITFNIFVRILALVVLRYLRVDLLEFLQLLVEVDLLFLRENLLLERVVELLLGRDLGGIDIFLQKTFLIPIPALCTARPHAQPLPEIVRPEQIRAQEVVLDVVGIAAEENDGLHFFWFADFGEVEVREVWILGVLLGPWRSQGGQDWGLVLTPAVFRPEIKQIHGPIIWRGGMRPDLGLFRRFLGLSDEFERRGQVLDRFLDRGLLRCLGLDGVDHLRCCLRCLELVIAQ
jgi:hypothetical protein